MRCICKRVLNKGQFWTKGKPKIHKNKNRENITVILVLNAMFVNTLLEAYKFRVFWGSPVDAEKY